MERTLHLNQSLVVVLKPFTRVSGILYDVNSDEVQSRFKAVWEHAIRLREEKGATVESYSFKQGFRTDGYTLICLDNLHVEYRDSYKPEKVLILRIRVQGQTFFVIELGDNFSGLVYRVEDEENFVEEGLLLLLSKIVASNGSTNPNFIDSYKGKLAKFNHTPAKNNDNNWVWNGIKKLLKTTS